MEEKEIDVVIKLNERETKLNKRGVGRMRRE